MGMDACMIERRFDKAFCHCEDGQVTRKLPRPPVILVRVKAEAEALLNRNDSLR